jgi:hypothetical protein
MRKVILAGSVTQVRVPQMTSISGRSHHHKSTSSDLIRAACAWTEAGIKNWINKKEEESAYKESFRRHDFFDRGRPTVAGQPQADEETLTQAGISPYQGRLCLPNGRAAKGPIRRRPGYDHLFEARRGR